ncbi:NUDIX hydrolase [Phytopseudomonas dryadis]|uniref:NUDIX hydrolase n=1 Tax=Phytopseudomonas dryadis TaxID=2487520 RepID=A0A4Q9RAZ7_9GAMM|nr:MULTISPECIES: NUDIX hydrolase [Pseudomonas]TBU97165.1 NUDIX hydrolase [Pseudomonas dryadis]TBV08493.1 NUDIX hydrolase [Pseudomonas dryadis]TBV18862.1 NUDIX hydrolase [Pseudomonas sp. FRB 230]
MSSAEVLASVDLIALRIDPSSQGLQLLLHRRDRQPFAEQWALPGVIVNGSTRDATLQDAAQRVLHDKAQVLPRHLEQVGTEGSSSRDPRGWSMSTYYLALLAPDTEAADERLRFAALDEVLTAAIALPFDHNRLVQLAVERLAGKSVYTSLPLYLTPARFTVLDALTAAQACLGTTVNNTSLRKRLERMREAGWIRDTGEKNFPKMGRPQQLFELTEQAEGAFVFDRSLLTERA